MRIRSSLVTLPLLFALACTGGGSPEPGQPAVDEPAEAGDASEPADGSVARPSAELGGTCRQRPRKDGTLVARLQVENTGNVGVIVRVGAAWPQAGGGRVGGLTRWQRVRVDQGATEDVTLRLLVAPDEAQAVRRAVQRERVCRVWRRVVGAYGAPDS